MAPCIEWAGYIDQRGYGRVGKSGYAHRRAYEEANGAIPVGMCVRHKCDNPPCVNTDHLVLGTHTENMNDMTARGRQYRGESQHTAVLTEADVARIKSRLQDPYKGINNDLAREFGVSAVTISHIKTGKKWSHVHNNQES